MSDTKTIIGVLASHDDRGVNESLVQILNTACKEHGGLLIKFQLLLTGGTFDRVITGDKPIDEKDPNSTGKGVTGEYKSWLINNQLVWRLPETREGGVTLLSNFVVNRECSILWAFLSPVTAHWILPENLALLRLCDYCKVKRLMNKGSVLEWFKREAKQDVCRNPVAVPPKLKLRPNDQNPEMIGPEQWRSLVAAKQADDAQQDKGWDGANIAVIAHDDMKDRMLEFVTDYGRKLRRVGRILATGTTGKLIEEAEPSLRGKVYRYRSGPMGGDIQIATEIVLGKCDYVFFFVDPLHSHPHIDDIRVVFGACMAQQNVRIFGNELHAREWMDRVP